MELGASLRLDHELLAVGADHIVHCMLELTAPAAPSRARQPLHLALVIDRSGSMAGPNLWYGLSTVLSPRSTENGVPSGPKALPQCTDAAYMHPDGTTRQFDGIGSDLRCTVCDRRSSAQTYCDDCDNMIRRLRDLRVRDMKRGREALRIQRNEQKALVCSYTGVELDLSGGPRDAEWDHVDPKNDPTSVAPAAAIVNRMKGEMTVAEFDAMIRALYHYRSGGKRPFDEAAFPHDWQPRSTARSRRRSIK